MAGVLLKKQEKMSQKGSKFAFLQLSDPTGVYEVVLFSEQLAATREHLEPGTLLLLTVEAEQKEDQIRFTVSRIEPLDMALDNKIQDIQIELAETAQLPVIKEKLEAGGKGMARVAFYVRVDGKRIAKIDLPGRWSLSSEARDELRLVEGVTAVREG